MSFTLLFITVMDFHFFFNFFSCFVMGQADPWSQTITKHQPATTAYDIRTHTSPQNITKLSQILQIVSIKMSIMSIEIQQTKFCSSLYKSENPPPIATQKFQFTMNPQHPTRTTENQPKTPKPSTISDRIQSITSEIRRKKKNKKENKKTQPSLAWLQYN